ncbi:MAG: hypothetical protein WBA98_09780 [Gordonia sp. (in: high G+C Gram-positive bacteria)]|uniref:hypothetical protein n=1 Tax=Gordonia sp. (in: high G+C Gram-positive bacteria) TaxID=84139 RepID=UPI003C7681FC
MTNPFSNPFEPPDFDAPQTSPSVPTPTPAQQRYPDQPAYTGQATGLPRPGQTLLKVLGWVILLFGALITIAALTDWSEPGMAVAMTFFGLAFIVAGSTMIWKKLPWRIAGPMIGVLVVICFVIVGFTAPDPDTTSSTPAHSQLIR